MGRNLESDRWAQRLWKPSEDISFNPGRSEAIERLATSWIVNVHLEVLCVENVRDMVANLRSLSYVLREEMMVGWA